MEKPLLHSDEPCRALTFQNVKLLEGLKSDETKTTEGLTIFFSLENDDIKNSWKTCSYIFSVISDRYSL